MFATCALACAAGAAVAQPVPPAGTQPPPLAAPTPLATPLGTPPPAVPSQSPGEATPSPTPTAPTGRRLAAFRVTADRIAFYSNRYVMEADGHVSVTLGDGTRIAGKTFFYDLRLNRFVIAGDVVVEAALSMVRGAAFSEYFDFDRAYFIPVLSQPDRWTFAAGDYAHPLFGREMPGDTFYLPDLAGERVFLYAKTATVDPHESVRFTPATINMGLAFVPFPSYFLNYSTNEYLSQNALSGAFADGPLDFAGGEHGLATAHIRYDSVDKVFPAVELHQVSDNHYLVASVNPLTRPLKVYNLLAYDRITPTLQFQAMFQESAFQHAFSQPLSAVGFANMQLTQALPHSFLQLSDIEYFDSLLARPKTFAVGPQGAIVYFYGDPSHNFIPNHPSNVTLSWIGFRHPLPDLPINFQLRSSFGVVNDSISPEETLGGAPYHRLWDKAVGINLTSKTLTLIPDKSGQRHDLYLTAAYDKQRQWFSLPRHIDTTLSSVSLTKVFNPAVTVLATYQNINTGDFLGALQSQAYPPGARYFNPYTGQTVVVSPSFRGFGTTRSFIEQLDFTPSQAVTGIVTMRENRDFPAPIAGTIQLVGDNVGFVNFGLAPYELDLDLRVRFSRVLVLDISRSNYFNFGGFERWSPQFSFQIEK